MGARFKARTENEVAIGWQVEKFAREGKSMKPLGDYLRPLLAPEQRRSQGSLRALQMFQRLHARQMDASGTS